MGSWNNTCGLTNLPIHSGEAVYVFPIMERDLTGYRSHCYASAFYQPLITPFLAKYNDYGAGEECTGAIIEPFLMALKSIMVEHDVGENQYHDIAVKKDKMDIDLFFEAIHEDRLQIKNYQSPRNIYFTMIRKDVVDALWTDWKFQIYVGKGKGDAPDDYYLNNITYKKIAESIPAYVAECIAELRAAKELIRPDGISDADWETLKSRASRRMFRSLLSRDDSTQLIARYLQPLESHDHYWDPMYVKELIHTGLEQEAAIVVEELLRLALIGMMVTSMMESVRKIWLPVMHMGSQSQEYPEYRLLNSIIENVIASRESEYEDEDPGDGYDDDLFSAKGIYLTRKGAVT